MAPELGIPYSIPYHRNDGTQRHGSGNVFPLDTYDAVSAYSTRLVSSTYSGDCIKIRRSSDNAITDIGFDTNGVLDVNAINTFVGTGSAFVQTWYDQSGNGNDLIAISTSTEAYIRDGGLLNDIVYTKNPSNKLFPALWFWTTGGTCAQYRGVNGTVNAVVGDSRYNSIPASADFGTPSNPGQFIMVYQPFVDGSLVSFFGKPGSGNVSNYHPIAQSTGGTNGEIFRGLQIDGREDAPLTNDSFFRNAQSNSAGGSLPVITNRAEAFVWYTDGYANVKTPEPGLIYSAKNMVWNQTSHNTGNAYIEAFGRAGSNSWALKGLVSEVYFFKNNSDTDLSTDNLINSYYKMF